MTDIVERLRDKHCCDNGCNCDEAADEIEYLRAALRDIVRLTDRKHEAWDRAKLLLGGWND